MEKTTSLGFDAVKLSGDCKTCSTTCYSEWLQTVSENSPYGFVAEYEGEITYLDPKPSKDQLWSGRWSRYHTTFYVRRSDSLRVKRSKAHSTRTHTPTHDQWGQPIQGGGGGLPITLNCKVYNPMLQVAYQTETDIIYGLEEQLELFPVCGNLEIQDSGSEIQWWGGRTDIYGGFSEHKAFLMLIKSVCKNKASKAGTARWQRLITSAYPLKSSGVEEEKKVGLRRTIYDRVVGTVTKVTTCIRPCDKDQAGCSNGTETWYEARVANSDGFLPPWPSTSSLVPPSTDQSRTTFLASGPQKFNTWQDAYDGVLAHATTSLGTEGAHNLGGIELDAFMPVSLCGFRMHMYGMDRKYGTGPGTSQPHTGPWSGFGRYGPMAADYMHKDGWTKTTSGREAFAPGGGFPTGPQAGPNTDINLNGWVLSTANDSYDFKTFQRIQGPPTNAGPYEPWLGVEFGMDVSYMRAHNSPPMRALAYYQAPLPVTAGVAPYPLNFSSLWERSWPTDYDAVTGNPETPALVIPSLIDITLQ